MEQKFKGRLWLILVVIFIALIGIYPPNRLFNPALDWAGKHNLKAGIDIRGGSSLIYEIQVPSGAPTEGLATQVIAALRDRVDPKGIKDIKWIPLGSTRIEIQMASPAGSEEARKLREELLEAQRDLETTNVYLADLNAVLKLTDPAARQERLEALAAGSPKRAELFKELIAQQAKLDSAIAARDFKAKVNAEVEIRRLQREVERTNLSARRIEDELESRQAKIEQSKNPAEREKIAAELNKWVEDEISKADFKARAEAITRFADAYKRFVDVRDNIGDAEDLKRLLRGSGVLEFRILVDDPRLHGQMVQRLLNEGPMFKSGDETRWFELKDPEQAESLGAVEYAGKHWALAYVTRDKSMVHTETGRPWGLEYARRGSNPDNPMESVIDFKLDSQGGALFADLTGANVGKKLAILLDDKMISAPVLRSRIGAQGQISGSYTNQELNYLIRTLNAGSLPARLDDEPISERTIEPRLGAENLRAGFLSFAAGIIAIGLVMILYYHLSGLVATAAVLLNILIIIGILAMFGATFTLPGIAALVLTIGMAVDANVLIFERLREEQLRGLSLRMALRNAYDRAYSAILDSNLTTIGTSLILFYFGSEEVSGFGLTLAIGVTSSMFTSLYVTRTVFDFFVDRLGMKTLGSLPLSFPKWDKALRPTIDWVGKSWLFYTFSAVLMTGGLLAFFARGGEMFDVEFVSGTKVHIALKTTMPQKDVLKLVTGQKGLESAHVQAIGDERKEYEIVSPNPDTQQVRTGVLAALEDHLDVDVPSRFEHFDESFDAARDAGAVAPITAEGVSIDGFAPAIPGSYAGGVAVVLNDLDPPLAPREIEARIARLGAELRTKYPFRKFIVESPARTGAPATTALVLFADEAINHERDAEGWEAASRNIWEMVRESIGRQAPLRGVTSFNPQVAGDAKIRAVLALTLAMLAIIVYIWIRFGSIKYGAAAIVALLHDVLLTVGFLGLSHYVANTVFGDALLLDPFRMNLTMVAALLTVMGYSVNNTIVVFDRIRENRGKYGHVSRMVINESINQTFSRSLMTSGTTLVTLFVMYIWGGPGIHGFTFALLAGILVGTYSSITIAAPLLLLGGKDLLVDVVPPVGQLQRAG